MKITSLSPVLPFLPRRLVLQGLYGITAIVSLSACSPATAPDASPTPVFVTEVRNDSSDSVQILSASIRPHVETELSFRVGGKVLTRLVEIGQSVQAGQVLAQLDPADVQLGVAAAREQLNMAEVDAAQAASDAARFKRLLAEESVGAADAERQQARADAATARMAQAKSQLDLARNRASYAALSAPYAGVITGLRMEVGQTVAEGQMVLTIARPGEADAVVDVPENMLANLRRYQASLSLNAGDGQSYAVQLRDIAPSASLPGRTFRARYTLSSIANKVVTNVATNVTTNVTTNAAATALPAWGMSAQLHLRRDEAQSATELPLNALLATDGKSTVWLVDPKTGSLTRQAVNIIAQTTNTLRVAGLPQGALVVSSGAQKLDAKMIVRPVARPLAAHSKPL